MTRLHQLRSLWVIAVVVMLFSAMLDTARGEPPYALVNPQHWHDVRIDYPEGAQVNTLWLHRRHAAMLDLKHAYVLIAEDQPIPVRLRVISYPTLYDSAVRVDFEPINIADKGKILNQNTVLLRRVK
ncbi:MAG TPA: hypothetical protein DF774_00920 [Rheinheimera sp.]|uniref:hypothetical protein n=1 Tax=Rheinheimera sp. TaxID=1869214 RepID=UPI000ED4A158|nr:hypothetical protein [Rheinheimera sp.]HCU64301.1 hypothetical protein [Rheinheimera sp.]